MTMIDKNKIQQKTLVLLRSIKQVLNKNNIHYSLAYGSVLGAVRHNGFIPWDYDVDIYIDIDKYLDACSALKRELPSELCIYCKEFNSDYEEVVARVCYKNVAHQLVHVDIFIVCGCPDDKNKLKRKLFWLLVYLSHRCFFVKRVKPGINYKNNMKKYIYAYLCKFLLFPIPTSLFENVFDYLIRKYPIKDSKQLYSACGSVSWGFWPKEWYYNTEGHIFEEDCYPIPKQWDEYLKFYYGEYLKPVKYNYDLLEESL